MNINRTVLNEALLTKKRDFWALLLLTLIFLKVMGAFSISSHLGYRSTPSILNQLFWISVFGSLILVAFTHYWRYRIAPVFPIVLLIPLFFLIGYTFLSVVWSTHPSITLRRATLEFIITFSVVFLMLQVSDTKKIYQLLAVLFGIMLLMNLMTFVIGQPIGVLGGFKGIYSSKNVAGAMAIVALVIGAYVWFYCVKSSWQKAWIIFYMLAWFGLLLLSESKTSIALLFVAPLIAIGLYFLIKKEWVLSVFYSGLLIIVAFSSLGTILGFDVWGKFIEFGLSLGFTGRDLIWKIMFSDFDHFWVLGHGYGAFWDVGEPALNTRLPLEFLSLINQGHNGYLDLLLSLGTVGFVIYLILQWQMFHFLNNKKYTLEAIFPVLTLLVFVLFHNLTESSLLRGGHITWILFLMVYVFLIRLVLTETESSQERIIANNEGYTLERGRYGAA